MSHDKRKCLERAKSLLKENTDISVRYAALELRFCMEAITYEKIIASAKHIPPHILDKWQPPQAVKALLEHEPNADKGFTLYIGTEKEYGVPSDDMKIVGEHRAFKLKWLRKHYNKVGKYLHYQHKESDRQDSKTINLKPYLEQVVSEIEDVLNTNITGGWIGEAYTFNCEVCSDPVVVAKHSIEKGRHFSCQNPNCKAEYFGSLVEGGEKAIFQLKVTKFNCVKCQSEISVENRLLKLGLEFECSDCNTKHTVVNKQWMYSAEVGE